MTVKWKMAGLRRRRRRRRGRKNRSMRMRRKGRGRRRRRRKRRRRRGRKSRSRSRRMRRRGRGRRRRRRTRRRRRKRRRRRMRGRGASLTNRFLWMKVQIIYTAKVSREFIHEALGHGIPDIDKPMVATPPVSKLPSQPSSPRATKDMFFSGFSL